MRDTVNAANARTVAVVRARLPYIDRRALSQAWFSALGLPERGPFATTPDARTQAPPPHDAPARPATSASSRARVPMVSGLRVRASDAPSRAGAPDGQKASSRAHACGSPASTPAAARALRYPPVHAAFRLELDGGRVHVVVRREGAVLHVIALCSERHVERVRRALGLAAEHLRLRGEALAADVRAFGTEGVA